MLSGRRGLQARHEFRFGTREIVIFGAAFLVIWGLAFAFGILVGRELGPAPGPGDKTASTAGGAAPSERAQRPGQAEALAPSGERLTFYQTLTAPTPEVPAVGSPRVEERIVPREVPPAKSTRKGEQRSGGVSSSATVPAAAPSADRRTGSRSAVGSQPQGGSAPVVSSTPAAEPQLWTVQVSSFRSRALAEELRVRLAAQGFDAYLVSMSTEEGRVRHRVRVGGFTTRTEAERVAAELRSERSLNPFVTTRTR